MEDEIRLVEPFPVWAWPLAWEWLRPVRSRVCDDFSPQTLSAFVEYSIGMQRRARVFAVYRGAELGGVIVAEQVSPVLASVHVLFSRSMLGAQALEAFRKACRGLFEAGARKLIGTILANNPLAVAFAKRAGFKIEGHMEANTLQEGRPSSIVLVGITREAFDVVSSERIGIKRRKPEGDAGGKPDHGQHLLGRSDGPAERPGEAILGDDPGDVERRHDAGSSGDEDGVGEHDQQGVRGGAGPHEQVPGEPRIRPKRKGGPNRLGDGVGSGRGARGQRGKVRRSADGRE